MFWRFSSPLSVAEVVVDFSVAGLTETHKIVPCVSAAFRNGQNVVNFLHRSQPTFFKTLFAEGMFCRKAVANTFPCPAVLAIDIGIAFEFVVLAAFLYTVLFTKLPFTEVGTARVRAGSAWLLGHLFTSFGMRKAPRECSHEAVLDSFLQV
jgi:hypothetical protein|nr:MAG TPA: hypothetical protein [Caudoviricetes sp.]